LKIDPQSVLRVVIEFCAWEILDSYANACVQWQDKDKAKLFFEESIKIDPKNVPTLNSYANACTQWGDKDKAIALFNKALSLEPGNIQVLDAYGKARARWGEKEESKKLLEKAKAIKATQPSTTTSGEGQEKEQLEELLRETAATPPPFTFTPEEKEWLTSTQNRERTWTGSPKWAAFGILYTLYYMRSQLESTAQLGDHSSRAKEHKRQYATLRDLAEILRKGETTPGEPTGKPSIQWEDQWFQKEGPPFQLMSYYDSQMHTHPRNPVSAAFLAQAIEAHGWGNIADVIKKEALEKWVGNDTKKWLPFMAHKSVNLLTVKGRERFLAFLQDRYPRQDATGAQPLDENSISRFIGRFSSNWEEMPHYFPQEQLTPEEENRTLNKLTGILENLETILKDITLHKNNAFGALGQSIEELAVPEAIMQRLDAYVDGLEKHAPTPSLPED
ncbi:MAG: hypothetical protein GY757_61390, partial [bacterium]|nr:hypothetical protein [bacterium]